MKYCNLLQPLYFEKLAMKLDKAAKVINPKNKQREDFFTDSYQNDGSGIRKETFASIRNRNIGN